MSDVINANKLKSLIIGKEKDAEIIYTTARALASKDRISILQLLVEAPMTIYEISKKLNIPISTVSNHIKELENAQILFVTTQQGIKRHVKMCSKQINELTFKFYGDAREEINESYTVEMPVGYFIEANVAPPCGMYLPADKRKENQDYMLSCDSLEEIYSPERFHAELLWFDHGFVTYNFPNKLHGKKISKIALSFELCSETIYHRLDWPSDIIVRINDNEACVFTSPGDFGGRAGKYSPADWNVNSTQYGQLYKIVIDENGVYLNNILVNKKNIDQFNLSCLPFIKIAFGIKEDAVHCGGLNLFGKEFGDYNQAIVLTIFS